MSIITAAVGVKTTMFKGLISLRGKVDKVHV